MVAFAEFLGRDQSTCTRGVACICKKGDKKQVSPEKMVNDSQWTAIDYANPETFPDENRVCLVAWSYDSGHPMRNKMYEFNDAGDDMRMWGLADDGDVMDWDGIDENPTHWMYVPEYQP